MKTALFHTSFLLLALVAKAASFGDAFTTGTPADYLEGNLKDVQIKDRTLILKDTQIGFRPVSVTAGKAYQLSFEAFFTGDSESIEDNPRFDLFTLPFQLSPLLPSRQIQFLDQSGKPVGRSLKWAMPFREKQEYLDLFHVPPTAVSMKLVIGSGKQLSLSLRDLKLEQLPADSEALNLNPSFALGVFNYSGWQNIAQGGKLTKGDGKTIFDTKYGSRGSKFPLAGPGTYTLSAKATGNGFNSTAHVDIFDAEGKTLMRASVRDFEKPNYFVVPAGATSASLLVYSCLLEEVRLKRVGDEEAIEKFR
ncbi:hypothetical protein V2O64_01135 [Verrucomicrobiaceae bacterium 227]